MRLQFFVLLFVCCQILHAEIHKIGVLSFKNLTGHKEHDWIAEAFSGAVIRKLKKITNIHVSDRHQLDQRFEIQKLSLNKAEELSKFIDLDFIIFGSVQVAGALEDKKSQLRVHARWVDTERAIIHNAIVIDGLLNELFDLQYQLTKQFVDLAKIKTSISEINAMRRHETLSLEAYRLYNLGMIDFHKEKYNTALKFFEQAMSKHPGIFYADAHHQIGQVYLATKRLEELVERFSQDVSQLSPVYYDLGLAYEKAGDINKAIEAYKTFITYTTNHALMWKKTVAENFRLTYSGDGKTLLIREGNTFRGIDSNTGREQWKKEFPTLKKKMKTVENKIYFQDGQEYVEIQMSSGNSQSHSSLPKLASSSPLSTSDLVVSETQLEVLDPNKKKSLWRFNTSGDEKIIANNRHSFLVQRGRREIKSIRIQRQAQPTDIQGLLRLARCLQKNGQEKESVEIFKYLSEDFKTLSRPIH